jgi:hypothetical protein
MSFISFVLFCIGTTNLVVHGSIFDSIRKRLSSLHHLIEKLLSCMMCSGFWVGIISSLFFGFNPFFGGIISSLFSHVFGTVISVLESVTYANYQIPQAVEVENEE